MTSHQTLSSIVFVYKMLADSHNTLYFLNFSREQPSDMDLIKAKAAQDREGEISAVGSVIIIFQSLVKIDMLVGKAVSFFLSLSSPFSPLGLTDSLGPWRGWVAPH